MKKQIIILSLIILGIVAYSQDKPKYKYIVGECIGFSSFTNWRKDFQHEGVMLEVQLESLRDSSIQSNIMRFTSAYFKTKNSELSESKFLTMFQTIVRAYISKNSLVKAYFQFGVLETYTMKTIEIGALLGGGLHIGKFKKMNGTLELNHIWHSGGYNYLNVQIGLSTTIENLFN